MGHIAGHQITWCVRNTPSNSFDTINITTAAATATTYFGRPIQANFGQIPGQVSEIWQISWFLTTVVSRGTAIAVLVIAQSVFFWKIHEIWARFLEFTLLENFKNRVFDFKMRVFRAFSLFLISFGSKKDLVTHLQGCTANLDLPKEGKNKEIRENQALTGRIYVSWVDFQG